MASTGWATMILTRLFSSVLVLVLLSGTGSVRAVESSGPDAFRLADVQLEDREQVDQALKHAARLYGQKKYTQAAIIYLRLSTAADESQAAWALELYGVCLEQKKDHKGALAVYSDWLQRFPGTASETRVQQRSLALSSARDKPQSAALFRQASGRDTETSIYGSSSLMYRGLRRKVEGQDAETAVSSLAGDVDLHLRASAGNFLVRSRVSGGYLSDHSDRGDSDGRVSNLYVGLIHEPTGAELTVGRQRSSDNGVYGYLDGARFSYPVTSGISLDLVAGNVSTSSWETSDSDRQVYGLGADLNFPDPALRVKLYGVEQTYDGLTERRALGTEISWFGESSHYLLVADYDIKFQETNNVMFNGAWDVGQSTNLALSLGYQRSPFLTASNAIIGEVEQNLERLVENLGDDIDVYDAALEKTALNRYGSLVINQELTEDLRLVGEVYHYDLSDLPQWGDSDESADSDASTTLGLQLVWANALFGDDYLSFGSRYTAGEFADTTSVYIDEKWRMRPDFNLLIRLRASVRTRDDVEQDAYTVRPGLRAEWYFSPDLLLDMELGYEWLLQDFNSEDFEVHQGFAILGLRKRF